MNIAILMMFWVLVGWQFAFAEFFGGLIIIAVICVRLTLFFHGGALERLRRESQALEHQTGELVNAAAVCGMQASESTTRRTDSTGTCSAVPSTPGSLRSTPTITWAHPRRTTTRSTDPRLAASTRGPKLRRSRGVMCRCCAANS